MDISNYIETELYIIVPVLYAVGAIIKKSRISDKWIPIILGVMGIALVTAYKLAAYMPSNASEVMQLIFAGVTQGILCASASVYANNIVKQMKKEDGKNDDSDKSDSEGDSTLR